MKISLRFLLTTILCLGIATTGYSQINIVKELAGFNSGDQFGWSITGISDQNSDGVSDYAIGAPSANNYAGAVYTYSGSDHSLLQVLNGTAGSVFGQTLSSKGNLLIVGGIDAVYVYANGVLQLTVDGFEWGEVAGGNLIVGNYQDGAIASLFTGAILHDLPDYGTSACAVGDVDGDGIEDFVVSDHNAYGSGRGAFNVYSGTDASVIHHVYGATQSALFGYDVASFEPGMFIITARVDDAGGLNAGAVRIYSAVTAASSFTVNGNVGEQWGWSATSVDDVDGDNVKDVLVGAAVNAGKVILLSGNSGTVLGTFNGQDVFDNLGYAVSNLSGGLFAFGAPGASDGFNLYAGKVFIANLSGAVSPADEPDTDVDVVRPGKGKKGKGKKK